MDPQLQQLYTYIFDGWEVIEQSWWQRIKSKFTNNYRVTLISPIEQSKIKNGDWRYRVTLFLEPNSREAPRALEVCDANGKPRKINWYFKEVEIHQL